MANPSQSDLVAGIVVGMDAAEAEDASLNADDVVEIRVPLWSAVVVYGSILVSGGMLIGGIGGGIYYYIRGANIWGPYLALAFFCIVPIAIAGSVPSKARHAGRIRSTDRVRTEDAWRRLHLAEAELSQSADPLAFGELWNVTHKRLDYYALAETKTRVKKLLVAATQDWVRFKELEPRQPHATTRNR
jgi:hypothetical protein